MDRGNQFKKGFTCKAVLEILVIDSHVLGLKFANSRKYLNYKEIKFLSIHSLNRMLQWSELDAFVLLLGYLQWFPIRYYIFEYFYACIRKHVLTILMPFKVWASMGAD